MAQEPGNTLRQAKQIVVSSEGSILKEEIGGKDHQDIYQFRQTVRSSFDLRLSKLKANASLALLDSQGKIIGRSERPRRSGERISAKLRSGVYYVQVSSRSRQSTNYQLDLFFQPIPPALFNTNLSLAQGETVVLPRSMLNISARGQSADETVYTLTRLPEAGRLKLNGKSLQINSQFTQADIDNGNLSYTNTLKMKKLNQNYVRNFERSESTVVWEEFDGNDYEIYLYDDSTNSIKQLSNNEADDKLETIANVGVVWQSVDKNTSTFFFYNRSQGTTTQLAVDNSLAQTSIESLTDIGVIWSKRNQLSFYNIKTDRTIQLPVAGVFKDAVGSRIFWQSSSSTPRQLLFYDVIDDITVAISGVGSNSFEVISTSYIIWRSGALFEGNQLLIYNFVTEMNTALTDVDRHSSVEAANSKVVWKRLDGNGNELFLYDQSTDLTTQITNNGLSNRFEGWLDDGLIWSSFSSANRRRQLFVYNFATRISRPFTEPGFNNFQGLSGSNVFWSHFDGVDTELFSYNSRTTVQLQLTEVATYNESDSVFDDIESANAAWKAFDGSDYEIFFFNADQNLIQQLSNNQLDDVEAKITNSLVIWHQFDGVDNEIVLHNINSSTTTQLTDNLTNDFFEAFWNSKLFWRNKDGIYLGSFVKSDSFEFKVSDRSDELATGKLNISFET